MSSIRNETSFTSRPVEIADSHGEGRTLAGMLEDPFPAADVQIGGKRALHLCGQDRKATKGFIAMLDCISAPLQCD